jgi:multicomponent Na+:H+ antiporter subunit B
MKPVTISEISVMRTVGKAVIPFILLFAFYVQFHGDFGPGGGFQAGVIFAAGMIMYALIFGPRALMKILPVRLVECGTALGVLIYGGTGVFSLLAGFNFLDYAALSPHHPKHGQHWGIFAVELGVGITVTAVMIAIFYAFTDRDRG